MKRTLISSASPYESEIGFSRAVRVGDLVAVSGTAPILPDGSSACPNDAVGQTRRCLSIIQDAIEEAGGSLADVYRTRIYLTDAVHAEDVGRAHGEFFSDIRPAATMVVVKALLRDDWLVEIEAEALVGCSRKVITSLTKTT
ncbi:MAG: RidA family protein [candidate division Zixibacteria bacterium]|nr:RidA family protein [candidate division Zixibacteria bacterium]MDH3936173.1 RidA family protein [candidate division Zixibacteria bacterium]MDH4033378.1 RidA family protein [candidate division Zixibacteria bacterium]